MSRKQLYRPIYLQSGAYACEHGELAEFRASHQENIACKEALEEAIRNNYCENRLDAVAVYNAVVRRFGYERLKLVLATTIMHKNWDKRFSHDNREWARTVSMEAGYGLPHDHSAYYVVDNVHSALTDLFVTYFRKTCQDYRGTMV